MHIPDGYLSPQTCAALGVVMIPIWATAAKKLKNTLKEKQVPLLAIGAAFSFTIMMYNVPIPDGTTAHAVGASILAIILGPWAATVGVSIALIIQSFFFGDGGILALGANMFNMAFVIPFVSYYLYRLIGGKSKLTSNRRFVGSIIAGYISINVAAMCAGIELGLQPLLFHKIDGTPLYAPYGILQSVSAMLFAHLTLAGPLEAGVTGLVVKYLQRNNTPMLELYPPKKNNNNLKTIDNIKKFWVALGVLIIFAPLGLLARGTAYGEWSQQEIKAKLGYVPQGMSKFGGIWKALMPDYSIRGLGNGFFKSSLGYIFCAIAALVAILGITMIISIMKKKNISDNNM